MSDVLAIGLVLCIPAGFALAYLMDRFLFRSP